MVPLLSINILQINSMEIIANEEEIPGKTKNQFMHVKG